jgi:hypothetical protein
MNSLLYYLFLTAIGLTPCSSITVHIYTHKKNKEYRERNVHNKKNIGKCGPCSVFVSYTLAFALQLRKKTWKTLS